MILGGGVHLCFLSEIVLFDLFESFLSFEKEFFGVGDQHQWVFPGKHAILMIVL